MNLTREQAIENHRKMWNWIADETERLKRKVIKHEYFRYMGIEEWPRNCCYCCEYVKDKDCNTCPIQWPRLDSWKSCVNGDSPYTKWLNSKTYEEAAKYAREIANLPETEDRE